MCYRSTHVPNYVEMLQKEGDKFSIILPNSKTSSGHNGRPILASKQTPRICLHPTCCSLCLIKSEEKPRCRRSTQLNRDASLVNRASASHLESLRNVWKGTQSHHIDIIRTTTATQKFGDNERYKTGFWGNCRYNLCLSQVSKIQRVKLECVKMLAAIEKLSQELHMVLELHTRAFQALREVLYITTGMFH